MTGRKVYAKKSVFIRVNLESFVETQREKPTAIENKFAQMHYFPILA